MNSSTANVNKVEPVRKKQSLVGSYRTWGLILIGLFALFFIAIAIGNGGQVSGTEFSPYSFQTRSFRYTSPSKWSFLGNAKTTVDVGVPCSAGEVLKYLTNSTRTSQALTRWDLISSNEVINSEGFRGEAWPLTRALQMSDRSGTNLVWEQWSLDHPNLAAILWPAVQDLAIRRAYFVIPELLEHAYNEKTKEGLNAKIARTSAKSATYQVERLIELGQLEEAAEVIKWAISIQAAENSDESDTKRLQVLQELVIERAAQAEAN